MEKDKYFAKQKKIKNKEKKVKDFIIIISIILLILGGDFFVKKHLESTTGSLVQELQNLKEKTILAKETNNRNEIIKDMEKVETKWREISEIWSVIIVHQEIDNIEQAMVRARIDINKGNIEDAIPEIETAIFFAEHINEREKLKLKNIL